MSKDVPWDDSNWRQEFMESKSLSTYQLEILENGPRSLSQSWVLGAMHGEWRKMKGYKYPFIFLHSPCIAPRTHD